MSGSFAQATLGLLTLTLLDRLQDPGFTPRVREIDALVDLLVDEDLEKAAARAIGRVGPPAFEPLEARLREARPPLRAHIVRVIGRLIQDPRAVGALLAALSDGDPKTRRNAAIALGHVHREGIEEALLGTWDRDPRPEMRRTLAASLGKMGTARSLPILRESSRAQDPELVRIALRACSMVERTASREHRGRIDAVRAPGVSVDGLVEARSGLEDVLADELSRIAAVSEVRVVGPGRVRIRLAGRMDALFAARTMASFRFPLPAEAVRAGETVPDAIARAATSDAARAIFATWTSGAVRYRIAWESGGHKRAATWDAAGAIKKRAPDWINDPTASTWELLVSVRGPAGAQVVDAAITPRALEDPRFVWRVGDVPAASHPTIAAALARVGGARVDDIVWDPFVGSGAELIERAQLGPFRALHGSDIDPKALAVARANLGAAGVQASLEPTDALGAGPPGVTLVITNPPMGRRSSRVAGTDEMLDRFITHMAEVLSPGGRLVWLAPWPTRSRDAGLRAGLVLDWARVVDMGGFDAELQRWLRV